MNQLKQIINQVTAIPTDSLTSTFDLIKEGALDSLDSMEILLSVEDYFCINIPENRFQHVRTYGQFEALVKELTDEQH